MAFTVVAKSLFLLCGWYLFKNVTFVSIFNLACVRCIAMHIVYRGTVSWYASYRNMPGNTQPNSFIIDNYTHCRPLFMKRVLECWWASVGRPCRNKLLFIILRLLLLCLLNVLFNCGCIYFVGHLCVLWEARFYSSQQSVWAGLEGHGARNARGKGSNFISHA